MIEDVAQTPAFWFYLEHLVEENQLVIDRPRASTYPRLTDVVYPLDYGYLAATSANDGHCIDVWLGTRQARTIDGILCTVDIEEQESSLIDINAHFS